MRQNRFDRLFDIGVPERRWTNDMIDEFFSSVEAAGDGRVAEGKRVEVVDGERREYELTDDGEWERIDNNGIFNVAETDDGYSWSVDMSRFLPAGDFEASATINNGVLSVSFTETDE